MENLIETQPQGKVRTCQVCDEKQIVNSKVSHKPETYLIIPISSKITQMNSRKITQMSSWNHQNSQGAMGITFNVQVMLLLRVLASTNWQLRGISWKYWVYNYVAALISQTYSIKKFDLFVTETYFFWSWKTQFKTKFTNIRFRAVHILKRLQTVAKSILMEWAVVKLVDLLVKQG